jgi:nucleoside-diphosphate-sugar epimerase
VPILITGGAGFMGSHLADQLFDGGRDVRDRIAVIEARPFGTHGAGGPPRAAAEQFVALAATIDHCYDLAGHAMAGNRAAAGRTSVG